MEELKSYLTMVTQARADKIQRVGREGQDSEEAERMDMMEEQEELQRLFKIAMDQDFDEAMAVMNRHKNDGEMKRKSPSPKRTNGQDSTSATAATACKKETSNTAGVTMEEDEFEVEGTELNERCIRSMIEDVRVIKLQQAQSEKKTMALGSATEGLEILLQNGVKIFRKRTVEGASGWRSWHEELDRAQASLMKENDISSCMMSNHDLVVVAKCAAGRQRLLERCKTLTANVPGAMCVVLRPSLRAALEKPASSAYS